MSSQVSRGKGIGLSLAIGSAIAFGGSGVAAKPLIEAGLDPLHVVWLRVTGAALVMLPLAVRHRALVRRRPALLAGFGLLGVAGVQAFYFASISRIPVGVALLVEYLAPALVLGWVRFVQRRPVTRAAALGVVLAVGGLACVVEVWSGLGFDALGLALALAAACCQVGYFVLSDQGSDSGDDTPDPLGVIAYGLLVGAVVLTAVARPWNMNWSVLAHSAAMDGTDVPAWLLLGWIVLIATVVAYVTGVVSVQPAVPAGGGGGGLPGGGHRDRPGLGAARRAPLGASDRRGRDRPAGRVHRAVVDPRQGLRGPGGRGQPRAGAVRPRHDDLRRSLS